MIHFAVAFGLLLHVSFWGAGLAYFAMPKRWQRFWPVLIFPAGLALQSAVVWFGATLGAPGTHSYAWPSEILPAALLATALHRFGVRRAWVDLTRVGLVWAIIVGCLLLLVAPIAWASKGLTTISLGSCDAADYAAGARVLMEFSRGERAGFLGLTEVVQVHSVDNFFAYWVRLNHFTPSALMALNGSIFDCAPHEIAGLLTAVLLVGSVPTVFWMARAVVGYSGGVALIIAGVFAISPVLWWAVAQVAPGQLLAAQAIGWITWAGVALWRGRLSPGRAVAFSGVLAIGYWIILGSYNFVLIVALVPAVAYAGGLALWRRAWVRLAGWGVAMLAPLLACGAVFHERVLGLAERYALLRAYDFGWRVPAFTTEGWLGMVQGGNLQPWSFFGLRWLLTAIFLGLLLWALLRAMQQRRPAVWLALAISLPVMGGYYFLQMRAAQSGTNASYDAYKLLAVFYPLLLPVFCWWVTLRRSRKLHEWLLVCAAAGVVLAFNVVACGMFIWKMAHPPLLVDGGLRQLRKIEAMPDVRSLNLLVPDMWSRLWANAFLLRKEQYFETHTYEGRLNTPLRGEWDLQGGVMRLHLPGAARRELSPVFAIVDTRDARFVRARPAEGWHAAERSYVGAEVWEWTSGEAVIRFDNPQGRAVELECGLDVSSPTGQDVFLVDGTGVERGRATLSPGRQRVKLGRLVVPPGASTVVLRNSQPPFRTEGDPRLLGVCVFAFTLTPRS